MMEACWIPPLEECNDYFKWDIYEDLLYEIFRKDFIVSRPSFRNKPVKIRINPWHEKREESFWHLTCRDYCHKNGLPESRDPDLDRCKRIRWPRAFIENYDKCCIPCIDDDSCKGVYIWESSHKPKKGKPKPRVKLFLEEESYLLILENRDDYYQLITAYMVTDENSIYGIKREMKKKGAIYAGSAD